MSNKYKPLWLCKLAGHRYSVVWNMDGKSEATFCNRCGSWQSHKATTTKPDQERNEDE